MADKKITQLTDGGAPQAADEFVVARAGDNFKIDFASLETEVQADAVVVAPTTDARNVIQPTAATVIPLTVRGAAAQSDTLFLIEEDGGSDLVKVGPTGDVTLTPGAGSSATLVIKGANSIIYMDVGENAGIGGGALVVYKAGPSTDGIGIGSVGDIISFYGAGEVAQPAKPTTINQLVNVFSQANAGNGLTA